MPKLSWDSIDNWVGSRALFPILLSKITKFSPKNFTFSLIKLDRVVSATCQLYQIDPWASADVGACLSQNFGIYFWTGVRTLCLPRYYTTKFNEMLAFLNWGIEVLNISRWRALTWRWFVIFYDFNSDSSRSQLYKTLWEKVKVGIFSPHKSMCKMSSQYQNGRVSLWE